MYNMIMKRFLLTLLSIFPLMAFGLDSHYDDVTIVKTMHKGESIEVNPYADIGFMTGLTSTGYQGDFPPIEWTPNLGGVVSASYTVSDKDAFEISSEKETYPHEDGYYYKYTLKALKSGRYTFTGKVQYVSFISSPPGSIWEYSTACATYKIYVDVDVDVDAAVDTVKINGIWYMLHTKAKTAEVTYSYDDEGYDFKMCSIPTTISYAGITYRVTGIGECAFAYCSNLTSVTIGNSVTHIGDGAFAACYDLTSITIPNSVTTIGDEAFAGCESLTFVTIPNGVTSIGDRAFISCQSLSSVSIPESVTSIGDMVFAYCDDLTSVEIPNRVTSIGLQTFFVCSGLTSVTIGNNVTSIGEHAFGYCFSLASITIPNSVKYIDSYAFMGCGELTSVTIGSGVKSIRDGAFGECVSLEEIYCFAEQTPEVYDDTFEDVDVSNVTLYVPKNSYQQYKEHPIWGEFNIAIGTGIKQADDVQGTKYNRIYNLGGQRIPAMYRGINLLRFNDGRTRKVLR